MKIAKLRLVKEPNRSFIIHRETDPFTPWHHHPEYELVLIIKGKGRRMVGDHIDRFEQGDLVLLGPYLPHAWVIDIEEGKDVRDLDDEAFVIQFSYDFLGNRFFEIPEFTSLKKFLLRSERGYVFYGDMKFRIISILRKMRKMDDTDRLYALFRIFQLFGNSDKYEILASPAYMQSLTVKGSETMRSALQYIMQHFQKRIQIEDVLRITHKSYAAFYKAFKRTYGLSFTDYLLKVRIGYACKLLTEDQVKISEIAYDSGFDNLANFNRQFRKIKGITPSAFRNQIRKNLKDSLEHYKESVEVWEENYYHQK